MVRLCNHISFDDAVFCNIIPACCLRLNVHLIGNFNKAHPSQLEENNCNRRSLFFLQAEQLWPIYKTHPRLNNRRIQPLNPEQSRPVNQQCFSYTVCIINISFKTGKPDEIVYNWWWCNAVPWQKHKNGWLFVYWWLINQPITWTATENPLYSMLSPHCMSKWNSNKRNTKQS